MNNTQIQEVNELFLCECHSPEHQLIFSYDKNTISEEIFDEVYCHIHLNDSRTFWERLKYGLKYIFGYKSKYGAFDEIILDPNDWEKMQGVVDKMKRLKEVREQNGSN